MTVRDILARLDSATVDADGVQGVSAEAREV